MINRCTERSVHWRLAEEVIGFGCRKFFACGGCGMLKKDIAVGSLFVVSGAVRDEGVSYH